MLFAGLLSVAAALSPEAPHHSRYNKYKNTKFPHKVNNLSCQRKHKATKKAKLPPRVLGVLFFSPPLAPKPRTDRSALDASFARRRGADDVIIVRRGLLTDTTVANLALFDPHTARWYTPAVPLLAGTHRSALLSAGVLTPHPNLTPESLVRFTRLRLFNALLSWGECELPIAAVLH